MIVAGDLAREFEAAFGRAPRLYRAPGRVNLIGEHTDYNDGFVLPMALDRSTWVAAAPREDRMLVVRSREYGETVAIDLEAERSARLSTAARAEDERATVERLALNRHWSDYVRGVAAVVSEGARGFQPSGDRSPEKLAPGQHVRGADMLIASDVPIGAGLSSSAALEVAVAFALVDLAGASIQLDALAQACQRAEHEFAGTRCGIMDQMIACYGRAGHAMLLDTRSLARTFVPLPPSVCVVVCNTMVTHALASAEYNARRADCEAGVAALERGQARAWHVPGTRVAPAWHVARTCGGSPIRALRDATLDDLHAIKDALPDHVFRRCRHVITENDRVMRAASALTADDLSTVGGLMAASHSSLRDDYEVSCAELDAMVATVSSLDGVFGARMTGGGFGGCVVALVDATAVTQAFQQTIRERYVAHTGVRPDVWVCAAGPGVTSVSSATPMSLS